MRNKDVALRTVPVKMEIDTKGKCWFNAILAAELGIVGREESGNNGSRGVQRSHQGTSNNAS